MTVAANVPHNQEGEWPMCCCDKPNVNGELGYKWQPKDAPGVRPINPPMLSEYEAMRYDEPGRCGGVDSHCHHYRVVGITSLELLCKNGGGEKRIRLANSKALAPVLASLDSNARYWLLNSIYHAYSDGRQQGAEVVEERWRKAAAEKRIKTRKLPNGRGVRVWTEPDLVTAH